MVVACGGRGRVCEMVVCGRTCWTTQANGRIIKGGKTEQRRLVRRAREAGSHGGNGRGRRGTDIGAEAESGTALSLEEVRSKVGAWWRGKRQGNRR